MGFSHLNLDLPYSSFCMHIGSIMFWCLFFSVTTSSALGGIGNETDRLSLLELKKKITHDPLGFTSSWNDSIHFCQWQGVTCGHRHQRVTILDLQSQKLVGSISPHVGNLSFLKKLFLQNNSFIREIPPEIGRLHRLQLLELQNNTLTGEIPSNISGCSNLVNISLGFNQLVGKIPATLGFLSKLQYFSIKRNNLAGSIPPSVGNLSSLELFQVAFNYLSGSIPDSFGQLTKLTALVLGVNKLSGIIPSSIFNLSSIQIIYIGFNQIQGTLPTDMGINILPNLRHFSITNNQFTGSIPVSISNASNLDILDISENKLFGRVPSLENLNSIEYVVLFSNSLGNGEANDLSFFCSLTNASYLSTLSVGENNFGGVIPECISNLSTTLFEFDVHVNEISGSIPAGIGNLVNLEAMNIRNNRLSGHFPSEIGNLRQLQEMGLAANNFSGNIPSSLGNLTFLIKLYLGNNNFQGSIPSSLGKCQNLRFFDLSHNNLSGTISPEFLRSLSPISLDLSANQFTGVLPEEIGNLKNIGYLDISGNMISGEIPRTLGGCVTLQILSMGGNFFQGTIPQSLESLRGIEILDLSRNNLSGQIPEFLEHFDDLLLLNLSFNHFEGQVPKEGVFKNASATFVMGNNELCGGMPEFQLPKCSKKKRRLTLLLKLIIAVPAGLLGVTILLAFVFLCWSKKKSKETSTSGNSENLLLNVSYQSLLKATDGFSSANLIGTGSFGSVYKGILDQEGGKTIAVKVLNLLHRGASKSFIAECEAMRNIRHRNLVKVLTACSGVDYQGNDFKALVYEFMVNGNLDEWLHPTLRIGQAVEELRNLNLLQRLNIAIDVASALYYLHHHCQIPIVHCDLKPSNVLLDDEMTGHVGDFGLARFLLETTKDCSPNQSSSIGLRGSVGYAPPEYGMGNEVSTYGDIYSYGILLLEMFTGKRPTDDMFKDSLNLHDFVKSALPEHVVDITDPIILGESEEGETRSNDPGNQSETMSPHIHQECLILIFEIGVACSTEFLRERMNISDVVVELHSIRKKLLGPRTRRERLQSTG